MSILASMMGVMSEAGSQDNTPDAISWTISDGQTPRSTSDETVSGIYDTINLYYEADVTPASASFAVAYRIDSGTWVYLNEGSANTLTVANNETLGWRIYALSEDCGVTINVKNASDGNAAIDTFSVNLTVPVLP